MSTGYRFVDKQAVIVGMVAIATFLLGNESALGQVRAKAA